MHDLHASVRTHYPVVYGIRLSLINGKIYRINHDLSVVRMHGVKKRLVGRAELVRLEAEYPVYLVRPTEFVFDYVPIPVSEARYPLRLGQAFFAFSNLRSPRFYGGGHGVERLGQAAHLVLGFNWYGHVVMAERYIAGDVGHLLHRPYNLLYERREHYPDKDYHYSAR